MKPAPPFGRVGPPDPNELLVSSTVEDLVAGSGIEFEDRGLRVLRGVPEHWKVFAAVGF